jgi:uncharacterized membrane protein YcaP (DUF421 family)
MFDLSLPWWEFIARGALIYLALLVMVRLSGKRTVGQFTPFDLLVVMLLSEAVSNSLSGGDESVPGGLLVAATLVALNAAMGFLSSRSQAMEKVLDGEPVLVGKDGRFFDQALKRHRLSQGDMDNALREHDCQLDEMHLAMLEADGNITIQKKQKKGA